MSNTASTNNPQRLPGAPAPFNWRAHLPVHPAAEHYPLLAECDPAAFKALVENIQANGLRAPLGFWNDGGQSLLDGRNRLDALATLGLLYETEDHHVGIKKWTIGKGWSGRPAGRLVFEVDNRGYSDGDPYAIALSLNVHRRHLNAEQKRELIAKVLKANSELSDRAIGRLTKADHKTVGDIRSKANGEIPHKPADARQQSRGRQADSEIPNKTDRLEASGRKARGRKPGVSAKSNSKVKPEAKPVFASAEVSVEQRRAEYVALDSNGASELAAIERDWYEAERALEALTAHPVAQVAPIIPPERAALVTEIAGYFTALAAKLTAHPNDSGEAPIGSPTTDPAKAEARAADDEVECAPRQAPGDDVIRGDTADEAEAGIVHEQSAEQPKGSVQGSAADSESEYPALTQSSESDEGAPAAAAHPLEGNGEEEEAAEKVVTDESAQPKVPACFHWAPTYVVGNGESGADLPLPDFLRRDVS